jgi:hypothetical protein
MLVFIAYIIIPNILVFCFMIYSNKKLIGTGSDHATHISIIKRIKDNKHSFIYDYLLGYNEKYPFYPQLYHWLVSFLPERIYRCKYHYINLAVKTIEIIAFNAFLFYLYRQLAFDEIVFLYANIVFNTFPFSYAAWNAKNSGLSARGIGLVSGQVYLFLLVAYLLSGNFLILPAIFVMVFISALLSQMALQFILLSLPLVVVTFSTPELLLLPFMALGLFYILMPNVANNFLIGQFNHKKNYALFMAGIFILKGRPSIYRDFVWDFWIKLKANWKHALIYLFGNPLLELVYGFTYMWFVIYVGLTSGFGEELNLMYKLVLISLGLFFLTSFRLTRFLGEPQRYVEFVIPLISVLFVLIHNYHIILYFLLLSILGSLVPLLILKISNNESIIGEPPKKYHLINYLEKRYDKRSTVLTSNDSEILKIISGLGFKICRTDYSRYYKCEKCFYKYCYNNNLSHLSPESIFEYINSYNVNVIILNDDIYGIQELKDELNEITFQLKEVFGNYSMYSVLSK